MRLATVVLATLLAGCFPGRAPGSGDSADPGPPGPGDTDTGTPDTADTGCTDGDGDCYAIADGDCDDADASVFPGATERCDDVDNDCDGAVDEDAGATYYADADDDSYGDPEAATQACDRPAGTVDNGADCDDDDPERHPHADERANELDDDCDGDVDEGVPDVASLTSVTVTLLADGVQIEVDGSATGWDFGLAETGALADGWFGESCIRGDQPLGYPDYDYDVCHPLAADGGTLTRVSSVADVSDETTLFGSQIPKSKLTFFLQSSDGSACWTWGDDRSYYAAYGCAEAP